MALSLQFISTLLSFTCPGVNLFKEFHPSITRKKSTNDTSTKFPLIDFSIENIFPTVYVLFYITYLNLNPDSYRGSLSLLEVNVERKYFIELKEGGKLLWKKIIQLKILRRQ